MPLPTDILMQLVRARYTCLLQLRDLGRRQLELIEAGDMTGLFDVLAVKQKPLNDIQRIERALDPYRTEDPEKRPWPSADERANCARLIEECNRMLKEIMIQEKRCEETMIERRDATAAQLQRLRTVGQAHGAYAMAAQEKVNQLDLTSER